MAIKNINVILVYISDGQVLLYYALIWSHLFFYLGKISPQLAVEVLRMEPSEHDLISNSCRGQCLFICGNERHLLMVRAPEHKAALFGKAGGR